MHEGQLVYKILSEVESSLSKNHILKSITVSVGEFSCVNYKSLNQLYKISIKNSFAKSSKLITKKVLGSGDIKIDSIDVKLVN